MKGQYLAIETVMTLGMGIVIAIGSVTLFADYQSDIASTTEEKQAQTVITRIESSIFKLKQADSGKTRIQLPQEIGGSDYQISMDDSITVSVGTDRYTRKLPSYRYEFDGSAPGGTVNLYRRGDNFTLRG